MTRTFYVTTPIYYSTDAPHLGHAYTTLAADILARFKRARGFDVYFLTGTDEHGEKVEQAAKAAKTTVERFVDQQTEKYIELWKLLDIKYDGFIRTTDPGHMAAVSSLLQTLHDKGDIYKGKYEGWYCVQDEAYYPDSEVQGGKCPIGHNVERRSEESYFFKMSAYRKKLLELFKSNPDFVQPLYRREEVLNFFKDELRDLSISRTSFKWGIPLPFDPKHRTYVWFDALSNYITALGWGQKDEKLFKKFWPADVQLIGKDILRFHAVYWPTMLMAAGVQPPKTIFAHGWWTVEGKKMSKSFGNQVEPNSVVKKFGVDAFRYFLFREVPFGLDGDYGEVAIKDRFNNELAAEWGNLLNRVLVMIERYSNGEIPAGLAIPQLQEAGRIAAEDYSRFMDSLEFHRALETVWNYLKVVNKRVNDSAPWDLAKSGQTEQLNKELHNLCEALRVSALLCAPFMPRTSQSAWQQLGLAGNIADEKFSDALAWDKIPKGTKVKRAETLFPKIA